MSERHGPVHDCGGDAAAYVLGALEPAEAEAFRGHLLECVVCRDEVETLAGVVQALPMSAPQHAAPRRLRRRLLRAIREQPPSRAATAGRPASRRRLRPATLLGAAAGAAAAVAAAVLIALGGGPGATLSRVIRASVSGVSGSVQLRISAEHGELVARHLSAPPPGHVYEVWLKPAGSGPRPASVLFTVNRDGFADVSIPASLRGITAVMVTPEPAGGSPVPTHAPVIVASVA